MEEAVAAPPSPLGGGPHPVEAADALPEVQTVVAPQALPLVPTTNPVAGHTPPGFPGSPAEDFLGLADSSFPSFNGAAFDVESDAGGEGDGEEGGGTNVLDANGDPFTFEQIVGAPTPPPNTNTDAAAATSAAAGGQPHHLGQGGTQAPLLQQAPLLHGTDAFTGGTGTFASMGGAGAFGSSPQFAQSSPGQMCWVVHNGQ
mmetsp:Transcript_7334/g.18752  ORF Transcript_7334/g.18752 Transcript_7334/m.18752 type:complete len:201 (-) Transcript_7334:756-1358(-)